MSLPNSFANNTTPTGPQLDANEAALGALTTVPCSVAGTNTLVLTPNADTPTVTAYADYARFSGIAVNTNTGVVTARIGALASINVYRDSPGGPVALSGAELVQNCAFTLVYDSALNSGAGGFHLISTTNSFPFRGGTITDGSITLVSTTASVTSIFAPQLASLVSVTALSVSLTSLRVGATAATVTRILSALASLTYTVIPTQTTQAQNVALPGVQLGDAIALGLPSLTNGLVATAFVPAAGTVAVRMGNITAASIAAFTLASVRATAIGNT